jgi:hypothetical protein
MVQLVSQHLHTRADYKYILVQDLKSAAAVRSTFLDQMLQAALFFSTVVQRIISWREFNTSLRLLKNLLPAWIWCLFLLCSLDDFQRHEY